MAMSKLTFGQPKIFVRTTSGEQADWTELGVIQANTLTPSDADEFVSEWAKTFQQPRDLSFSCRCTCRWKNKWARIRLLQQVGLLKRPKCTYRTIKRFSAKKNRY